MTALLDGTDIRSGHNTAGGDKVRDHLWQSTTALLDETNVRSGQNTVDGDNPPNHVVTLLGI